MKKINSYIKITVIISLALGLMSVIEIPIDQNKFTYQGPVIIKFIIGFISWGSVFWVNFITDKKLSFGIKKYLSQLISFMVIFIYSLVLIYVQNILFKATSDMTMMNPILLNQTLYSSTWITIITRCFKIAFDYIEQSKKAAIANERLKNEKAKTHLSLLNQQVNLHFLFNSLNTLLDLIDPKNEQATSFLKQLSEVYRYVLSIKIKEFVTLSEELSFVNSYVYLLKQRFQDKLRVDINLNNQEDRLLIPPLTIQTLIENAIKHNEISNEFPLSIAIGFDANNLITKNTVKTKINVIKNGTGLKNLSSRVEHLTGKKLTHERTNTHFTVTIPLQKLDEEESIHIDS